MPTTILTTAQIEAKLRRMAYQIAERNFGAGQVWLAGIHGAGYTLAERLLAQVQDLAERAGIEAKLCGLEMEKHSRTAPQVTLTGADGWEAFAGTTVVVVDDVLNSGRTLAYAMAPLLAVPVKALQVAVLVERSHRTFPIRADFSGLALATTYEDHVEVVLADSIQEAVLR